MLELKDITKTYKTKAQNVVALDHVNLYFEETGMVFVTGKSGSGKTTLLNVIGGLDNFDEGELIIKNRSTKDFSKSDYDSYRNTYIGFIFQEYNLIETMSIEKNLALALELQGRKKDRANIENILKKVDLEDVARRKPQELSGGQRQRVAIARALIKEPAIIMADEPTGALDSANGLQVMTLLKKLSKEKLVIVVSHDLDLANKFADRIINLKDGKVESDITIKVASKSRKNLLQKKNVLSVKRGATLKDKDLTRIKQAVEQGKDVVVTDNINVIKKKTQISSRKVYKDASFFKTHMGVADTQKLGLGTLKTKVVRLVITILLCAMAFSIFGIFDSMAIYDESRLAVNTLRASISPSITFSSKIIEKNDEEYAISVNDGLIDSLSAQTGYDIKGVYDSYYMGNGTPSEIRTGQPAKISKAYYFTTNIKGSVEFDQEDIDRYGFEIIKGRLPENYDEIAIPEYYAYCLINWWYGYLNEKSEMTYVENIEDLVRPDAPLQLTLGKINGSKKKYDIVGIIKTGEINKKFDKIKGDGNDELKVDTVSSMDQNEFQNYILNGYFLYVFTKPGFSANALQSYNAPNQYKNSAYRFDFDVKETTNNKRIEFNNMSIFYNFDGMENYDVAYYFFDENQTKLGENEVMFDVSKFTTLYQDFYGELLNTAKTDEQLQNVVNNIETSISQLTSAKLSAQEKINALETAMNDIEYIQSLLDDVNGAKHEDMFGRVLVASKYDENSSQNNSQIPTKENLENREFKVAGFFAGLSSSFATSKTLLVNTDSLATLGINLNQGRYSTLLATNLGGGNLNKLSALLYNDSGLGFDCVNMALKMVQANGDFFQNLSLIFLIASGVFAVFSIVMFSNFISTSIKSKFTEIGILRALGARGSDILWMFIIESLTLALINAASACVVASVGSIFVNMFLSNYLSLFIPLATFGARQVFIIFALSILVGTISAALPIISISRQKPVETIRRAFD